MQNCSDWLLFVLTERQWPQKNSPHYQESVHGTPNHFLCSFLSIFFQYHAVPRNSLRTAAKPCQDHQGYGRLYLKNTRMIKDTIIFLNFHTSESSINFYKEVRSGYALYILEYNSNRNKTFCFRHFPFNCLKTKMTLP